jgi:hypothetical protein
MKSPDKSQIMPPIPHEVLWKPFRVRMREAWQRLWCRLRRHTMRTEETASDIGLLKKTHCLSCPRSWWV